MEVVWCGGLRDQRVLEGRHTEKSMEIFTVYVNGDV